LRLETSDTPQYRICISSVVFPHPYTSILERGVSESQRRQHAYPWSRGFHNVILHALPCRFVSWHRASDQGINDTKTPKSRWLALLTLQTLAGKGVVLLEVEQRLWSPDGEGMQVVVVVEVDRLGGFRTRRRGGGRRICTP